MLYVYLMMKTGPEGLALIKKWEGLVLKAANDGFGTLTVGYGHTNAAGDPPVTPGLQISAAQADEILKNDLSRVERTVSALVTVPLKQNQFDTLVSFQFNTGDLGSSTMLRMLNSSQYSAIPNELKKYAYANGEYVQGLANRRQAEADLWSGTVTPPQPPTPKPDLPAFAGLTLADWVAFSQFDPALFGDVSKEPVDVISLISRINAVWKKVRP